MRRIITLLFLIGIIVGITIPAYSSVENVKVGGDFTIYGAYRHDFSFTNNYKTNDFLQSSVRVWVSAQLSNNVSTMIRLINERDWGQSIGEIQFPDPSNGNVTLDLAYVKIITPTCYSITIGRQDLKIGQGFVIGSQYNAVNYNSGQPGFGGSGGVADLLAPDLGLQKSFDAIKIDYKDEILPLSGQAFVAKINGNSTSNATPPLANNNDVDLYGLSLLYAPTNWSIEPYIIDEYNYGYQATMNPNPPPTEILPYAVPNSDSSLSAAGLRGTLKIPSAPGLSFKGEYAKQFGTDEQQYQSYEGWAGYIGGKYIFQTTMKPYIDLQYSLYSGQTPGNANIKAWQPMYPSGLSSQFGAIGYPAVWAMLYGGQGFNGATQYYAPYYPGVKVAKIGIGFQPLTRLAVYINYYNLSLDKKLPAIGLGTVTSDSVGNELDLGLNYAYSQDVNFGLTVGQLFRGDYIKDYLANGMTTDDPWEALGSMTVSF